MPRERHECRSRPEPMLIRAGPLWVTGNRLHRMRPERLLPLRRQGRLVTGCCLSGRQVLDPPSNFSMDHLRIDVQTGPRVLDYVASWGRLMAAPDSA
jgi:hypothetical protein